MCSLSLMQHAQQLVASRPTTSTRCGCIQHNHSSLELRVTAHVAAGCGAAHALAVNAILESSLTSEYLLLLLAHCSLRIAGQEFAHALRHHQRRSGRGVAAHGSGGCATIVPHGPQQQLPFAFLTTGRRRHNSHYQETVCTFVISPMSNGTPHEASLLCCAGVSAGGHQLGGYEDLPRKAQCQGGHP